MAASRVFFDLYAKSPVSNYRTRDKAAFESQLQRLAVATQLRPLTSPQELQLDANGRTIRGDLRLSMNVFRRLCGYLATGLNQFLPELAGMVRTTRNTPDLVDGRQARLIWNELVALRFSRISRHRILCDMERRTIDGLAKANYSPFIREDIYTVLRDTFAGTAFQFYAASLLGRAMTVWLRDPTAIHSGDGVDWHRGYYVAVGELAGIAPRLTPAVLFPRGVCLAPFSRFGCVLSAFTADEAAPRIGRAFAEVRDNGYPDSVVQSGFAGPLQSQLGFAPSCDITTQEDVLARLAKAVAGLGVQLSAARAIVRQALVVGRDVSNPDAARLRAITTTYSGRTVLDLLVPLCQTAMVMPLRRREAAEQAAFQLLTEGHPAIKPGIGQRTLRGIELWDDSQCRSERQDGLR